MPHILKARQFGMEAVIITERTVKCCSCSRVTEASGLYLWLEIKTRMEIEWVFPVNVQLMFLN